MKKVLVGLAILSSLSLSGCPGLGIGTGTEKNTLVIHNHDYDQNSIESISVVRVPDECSDDKPVGVNLLPAPLVFNGTFNVEDLENGRYYCVAEGQNTEFGYVTLSGGTVTEWYVQDIK